MQHLLTSVSLLAILAPSVAAQSLRTYGSGTKGSNGKTPELWARAAPRPGESKFAFLYENGLPNANAMTVISAAKEDLSIGGLTFLVKLAAGVIAPAVKLDANGVGALPVPIPNDSSIIGLQFHSQGFVVDATASLFGLSATNGMTLRIARPGMVVTQSSAIDLKSGRVANLKAAKGYGGDFVPILASYAALIGTRNTVSLYDTSVHPPKFVKTAATVNPGFLQTMAVHPNGLIVYPVPNAHVSLSPVITPLWATPQNFGTKYPAPAIDLGKYKDGVEMVCSPDGKYAYLGSLGLISAPSSLNRIDIDPSSKSFHKFVGTPITWPGRYVWGIDISRDGRFVFVAMGPLSGQDEVGVVDTLTWTAVDFDPVKAGQQNLGAERPARRAQIPKDLINVRVGPRMRYLYMAHSRGIVSRLDYRSEASTYKQIVQLQTPSKFTINTRGLEVSDAGEHVYFDAGSVYEIDAATMKILRTFRNAGGGWHCTVR